MPQMQRPWYVVKGTKTLHRLRSVDHKAGRLDFYCGFEASDERATVHSDNAGFNAPPGYKWCTSCVRNS